MSLTLSSTLTAITPGLTSSFGATGGTEPYTYSVLPGGAGGSINSGNGTYVAPATVNFNPAQLYDTIQVTDALAATATAKVLVGTPLLLFCEIIQREMALADGRVFLWDQKIFQPTDAGLYIAVSVPRCKPFGNNTKTNSSGDPVQSVNMLATVEVDIMSRGPDARERKEEIILALNSQYAQAQQAANSFNIGRLPTPSGFQNLSVVDGAAIPYRYNISINMQYFVTKTKPFPYFDAFAEPSLAINP